MVLPVYGGEIGLVPLVNTTKVELQDRCFLQGHAPLIARGVTREAALQQLDSRCQLGSQGGKVILMPEERGKKKMGVIVCGILQKERHLSDEHLKLKRSSGQVPARWDNRAWPDSSRRRPLEASHSETLWLPWESQRSRAPFNLVQR